MRQDIPYVASRIATESLRGVPLEALTFANYTRVRDAAVRVLSELT